MDAVKARTKRIIENALNNKSNESEALKVRKQTCRFCVNLNTILKTYFLKFKASVVALFVLFNGKVNLLQVTYWTSNKAF